MSELTEDDHRSAATRIFTHLTDWVPQSAKNEWFNLEQEVVIPFSSPQLSVYRWSIIRDSQNAQISPLYELFGHRNLVDHSTELLLESDHKRETIALLQGREDHRLEDRQRQAPLDRFFQPTLDLKVGAFFNLN